jgi:polar amino acid transport system permease protein
MTLKIWGLLVEAAFYTAAISGLSIAFGFLIGLCVSAASLSTQPGLAIPARAFISFFRGVPLLVQLLLIYNLLPAIGINVPSVVAAVVGLSLCTAAYQAENLRGGFVSVPRGLLEAAAMTGMSPLQQLIRIRAPIAFRLTLPSLVNEAILILKASSLISVVGVIELTRMAQNLDSSLYQPIPLYAAAGLLYFIINRIIAYAGGVAERRFTWGRV